MHDDPPETPTTPITASADGSSFMAVQGHGEQIINFGVSQTGHGVAVAIMHDRDVEIGPGESALLSVNVLNHGTEPRELRLAIAGDVPRGLCTFDTSTVTVPPEDHVAVELTVRAERTEPVAGLYDLLVTATDPNAGPQAVWPSKAKPIRFRSAPGVKLSPVPGVDREPGSNTYRSAVLVENTGNARVIGTLAVDPTRSGERVVKPGWVEPVSINLRKGGDIAAPLKIEFPTPPPATATWVVPLMLRVEDGTTSTWWAVDFTVVRHGLVEDVATAAWRAAEKVIDWCRPKFAVPRGFLLLGGVVLLLAGLVPGWLTDTDPAAPVVPAAGVPSAANTTTTTSPVPAPEPTTVYSPMPCEPGTHLVFLATVHEDRFQRVRNYTVARAEEYAPALARDIKATEWNAVCAAARAAHSPQGGDPAWRVLWLGPFGSAAAGADICKEGLKEEPGSNDCVVKPAT